jgi:hypothetical protein
MSGMSGCRALRGVLSLASLILVAASPPPPGETDKPTVVTWLDRAVPEDLEPGSGLTVGLMLWDERAAGPMVATSIFVRLHAADGGGPPTEVTTREDWPGHYSPVVEVPPGGMGELEVGMAGTACTDDGCERSDWIFPIVGVGPPPEAPLTAIADAAIATPDAVPVAGQRIDLDVVLRPRADWAAADFPTPDALVVTVRVPRGPTVAELPAPLADGASLTYRATGTLPGPGTFAVQVATRRAPNPGEIFGSSLTTLEAQPSAPPRGSSAPGLDPVVWIGLLVAGALTIGVAIVAFRRAG